MPGGPIAYQQDKIVFKFFTQFLKEKVHAHSIALWQYKKERIPGAGIDSAINIAVFSNMMARNLRTDSFWTPAVFGLVDSSKACFILEHQPHFSTFPIPVEENFSQFIQASFNFFEDSMSSSLAFLGCLLRGITLRHPCRFSTR